MALSILDGTQTATTLSTILSSGQHITAHTVVSLGTQAKTDILSAVSSGIAISGTVTANVAGSFNGAIETVNDDNNASHAVAIHMYDNTGLLIGKVGNPLAVSGTVTIGSAGFAKTTGAVSMPTQAVLLGFGYDTNQNFAGVNDEAPLPVRIYNALPAGTNRIGVVTIGAGTVTIGAGTAQIGSVTASISNSVTIGSLPAISGVVTAKMQGNFSGNYLDVAVNDQGYLAVVVDNQIGISELPNIAGTVTANTFAAQGTAVTTSNFTSTTASTVLAGFNAGREVLTIFNEGAGNLHIAPGATCTTIAYQVRLSSGDYYEAPNHQTSLTHSAVFATAGTARVTQVS